MNVYKSSFLLTFIFALIFTSLPSTSFGQFKKLIKKTTQEFERQATNEISKTAVTLMMRPVRRGTNKILMQKYKDKYGEDFDDSKYDNPDDMERDLLVALSGLSAELPPEYMLLYEIEYEVKENKDKSKFDILVNPDEKLFAIRSNEKDQNALMLFDYANDIMATYDLDKMEVLAFKHVMTTANAYQANSGQSQQSDATKVSITKKSGTKKIAKCECTGYDFKSEDSTGEIYFCNDLPFSWLDMYGGMVNQVSPGVSNSYMGKEMSGVPFYIYSEDQKDNSKNTMEAKKWSKRTMILHNADYTNQFVKE